MAYKYKRIYSVHSRQAPATCVILICTFYVMFSLVMVDL